jgi:hypothetical protein
MRLLILIPLTQIRQCHILNRKPERSRNKKGLDSKAHITAIVILSFEGSKQCRMTSGYPHITILVDKYDLPVAYLGLPYTEGELID